MNGESSPVGAEVKMHSLDNGCLRVVVDSAIKSPASLVVTGRGLIAVEELPSNILLSHISLTISLARNGFER